MILLVCMRNSKQKQADLVLMSGKKKNKSLLVSLSGKSTKNALKFLSFHSKKQWYIATPSPCRSKSSGIFGAFKTDKEVFRLYRDVFFE